MPALPQPQLVPLIFEGLDTFTDPKKGIATKLDLLENCYVATPLKLQKRNGFTSQSRNIDGGGSVSAGAKLASYRNELVMGDGLTLYTRNSLLGTLAKRGKLPTGQVAVDRITGDNISADRLNVTGCYAGGVLLLAWQTSAVNTITWQIQDNNTGAVLATGTISSSKNPKAVACNGFLFLYAIEGTAIKVHKVDPATPSTFGAATTVTTAASIACYDVVTDTNNGGTGQMLVAYCDTAATTTIAVRSVTSGLSVSGAVTFVTAGGGFAIQVVWLTHSWNNGSGYLSVSWQNAGAGAGVRVHDINTTTLAMSNATDVDGTAATGVGAIIGGFASSTRTLFIEKLASPVDLNVISGWAGGTTFELMRGVCLSTKIFFQGGRWYFAVSFEDAIQRHKMLVEYEPGTNGANGGTAFVGYLAAKDDGGKNGLSDGGVGFANISDCVEAINYGGGAWAFPGHYSFDLGAHYGVVNHRLTFSETGLGTPVNFAESLFVPGFQLNQYDGAEVVEAGFYLRPKAPTAAAGAAASKSTGTYLLKALYRWTDSKGRIWRSEASPQVSQSLGGANLSVDLTVATLRVTGKDPKFNLASLPKVVIEAYSTIAGGTTFYLDTVKNNDVTANTVTINCGTSDAVLQTNELLYQQGGVLGNETPPAVRLVRGFAGRLFVCAGDGEIWHSKDLAEGEGVGFSARFRLPLDVSAGKITALMDMDQTFLMGQRSGIYVLGSGDPTDTGANLFGSPTRVNTTVGPLDQVTVVRLPGGMAFNSSKGICLMSRGLEGQFIGQQVQRYTQADTLTGAMVADGKNWACWSTSNGDLLVYDWVLNQWFVFTGLAAVACATFGTQLALLASDGTVKLEAAGVFSDDSTAIVMKIRTAWISLAQLAGYQRLWDVLVVGEYKGAHTLQLSLAYNFSTFNNETLSINAGTFSYNTGIEANYVWEAQPKQQLCTAVQLTVQDVLSGAGSEGFQLSGMALNVGVLGEGTRLPATHGLA